MIKSSNVYCCWCNSLSVVVLKHLESRTADADIGNKTTLTEVVGDIWKYCCICQWTWNSDIKIAVFHAKPCCWSKLTNSQLTTVSQDIYKQPQETKMSKERTVNSRNVWHIMEENTTTEPLTGLTSLKTLEYMWN